MSIGFFDVAPGRDEAEPVVRTRRWRRAWDGSSLVWRDIPWPDRCSTLLIDGIDRIADDPDRDLLAAWGGQAVGFA